MDFSFCTFKDGFANPVTFVVRSLFKVRSGARVSSFSIDILFLTVLHFTNVPYENTNLQVALSSLHFVF